MTNHKRLTQNIQIEPCGILRLDRPDERVAIIDGPAWITAEGTDIIAGPGETLTLAASPQPVLISGLNCKGITVQISRQADIEVKCAPTPVYRITPRARRS